MWKQQRDAGKIWRSDGEGKYIHTDKQGRLSERRQHAAAPTQRVAGMHASRDPLEK